MYNERCTTVRPFYHQETRCNRSENSAQFFFDFLALLKISVMSGETFSLKSKRAESKKEEVSASVSRNSDNDHTDSDDCDNKDKKGYNYGCWAPVIIFIIIFIIFIVLIACTGWDYGSYGGGCSGYHMAGAALLFFIIWILILCFFCKSGDSTMAWFFLLLIIAIAIIWCFASFLNRLSCC